MFAYATNPGSFKPAIPFVGLDLSLRPFPHFIGVW